MRSALAGQIWQKDKPVAPAGTAIAASEHQVIGIGQARARLREIGIAYRDVVTMPAQAATG